MQIAIIAGLFAFLGAVVGQLLSRNTQRETWLLQKRAEVFSKFYSDLEAYESEIFRLDYVCQADIDDMKERTLALEKLYTTAYMVRLYLSSRDKKSFMDNLEGYIHFKFDTNPDTNTFIDYNLQEHKKRDLHKYAINHIFEHSLEKISWFG